MMAPCKIWRGIFQDRKQRVAQAPTQAASIGLLEATGQLSSTSRCQPGSPLYDAASKEPRAKGAGRKEHFASIPVDELRALELGLRTTKVSLAGKLPALYFSDTSVRLLSSTSEASPPALAPGQQPALQPPNCESVSRQPTARLESSAPVFHHHRPADLTQPHSLPSPTP